MGWETQNNNLTKEFEFENFVEAVEFVKKIATPLNSTHP